jgi:hypothetical protein
MAGGITLDQAQTNLDAALAALAAARGQQSYQIAAATGGRSVTRASAADLLKEVQYWEQKIASLKRGGKPSMASAVIRG